MTITRGVPHRAGRRRCSHTCVCGPKLGLSGEEQDTSFDITATPILITNNIVRCPPGSTGIKGKIHNLKPPFIFVNQGKAMEHDHVESDPLFVASLESGDFAAEYAWWLLQWHAFLRGPFLRGRDWSSTNQ